MKVLAGTIAGFMFAASLSVAAAPAQAQAQAPAQVQTSVAADPYTPRIRTYAEGRPLKAAPRRARFIFRLGSNGAGTPRARVVITIRNAKGRVVKKTQRNYRGGRANWVFGGLPKGRYTVSVVAIVKNKNRFFDSSDRFVIRVQGKKRRR